MNFADLPQSTDRVGGAFSGTLGIGATLYNSSKLHKHEALFGL